MVYDYSNAQHLEDITFPAKFTISEAGQTLVEAQITSLTKPGANASMYTPTGLNALGVGFPLTSPWNMQNIDFEGRPNANPTTGQFVVVRAMVSPDGTLSDAEVLATSNPSLNQKALDRASQSHRPSPQDDQNGATPQSHKAFFTTLFRE